MSSHEHQDDDCLACTLLDVIQEFGEVSMSQLLSALSVVAGGMVGNNLPDPADRLVALDWMREQTEEIATDAARRRVN